MIVWTLTAGASAAIIATGLHLTGGHASHTDPVYTALVEALTLPTGAPAAIGATLLPLTLGTAALSGQTDLALLAGPALQAAEGATLEPIA